eukprot:7688445-Lingulodinium_polyedra.AAC.1
MSELPVTDLLRVISKPTGAVPQPNHFAQEARLLESLKTVLRTQAESFVKEATNMPILTSYSSDGTPVKTGHS